MPRKRTILSPSGYRGGKSFVSKGKLKHSGGRKIYGVFRTTSSGGRYRAGSMKHAAGRVRGKRKR